MQGESSEEWGNGIGPFRVDLSGKRVVKAGGEPYLELPYGSYEVRLTRDGCRDYVERITVGPPRNEWRLQEEPRKDNGHGGP